MAYGLLFAIPTVSQTYLRYRRREIIILLFLFECVDTPRTV